MRESDDSDGDLSDHYSEAEEVIRTRLSQAVVEEPEAAQDARSVLLLCLVCSMLHVSFYFLIFRSNKHDNQICLAYLYIHTIVSFAELVAVLSCCHWI